MLGDIVLFIEGFDPLFNIFNSYEWCLYTALFLYLFKLTKNHFALLIILESLINFGLSSQFSDIPVISITGQFMVYGFVFYIARKNPLIALSYLILIFTFLVQYIINSIHESVYTMTTYNIAMLAYYSYYFSLPIVLYLMIKGLFHKSGGRKHGYDHSSYNAIHVDEHGFYNNMRRLSKSFSRSVKRVIQK